MITTDTILAKRHFHMLGVGGMGMAPLALFLKQAGCSVTGEDDNFHPRVHELLQANGIEVSLKPDYSSIDGVIYSNAIGPAHPALKSAVADGVSIMRRGEFLSELSKRFKTVAVAGSHGKTTTCGFLIHALKKTGFPCNYILGGLFASSLYLPGQYDEESPWLVIEVDESDGSIHTFEPTVSLVVNVDWDHADYYTTRKKCVDTFQGLVSRTTNQVFLNQSCQITQELDLSGISAAVHTFGSDGEFQLKGFHDGILEVGGSLQSQSIPVPFKEPFNALNAIAALSVVHMLNGELPPSVLGDFPGLWRRQEVLFEQKGFCVVEDYGHHPTEIRKLFEALQLRDGPLTVVFQPHRFSRTLQFKHEFAEVLGKAQALIVMEVYGAGEELIVGGSGRDLFKLCSEVAPRIDTYFCEDHTAVMKRLESLKPSQGVLLFLGAGNIQNVAAEYVEALSAAIASEERSFLEAASRLVSEETLICADESLANKTTLRVGGSAEFYAEPASEVDLQILLRQAAKYSVDVYFLGRGSNLIVPDSGVRGLVIRLSKPFFQKLVVLDDGRIRAGAGVRLKELCGYMRRNKLAGFEFLEGIPGCVGGAMRMNAGAMGGWISEVVSEVVLMNYHGDISTVSAEDLHFGYRHCLELLDTIGLAVIFKTGNSSSVQTIQHVMDAYQSTRKESQPRQPSAGCTFKNPEDSAAGKLIDESGLKGSGVGGAEVSDIHANFIVNQGSATASDAIELINNLRKEVYQKTGYVLEPEVILFGDHWENYLDPLPAEPLANHPVSPG